MQCRGERTRRRIDEPPSEQPPYRHSGDAPLRRRAMAVPGAEPAGHDRSGMKLVVVIVSDPDADGLIRAMVERGYPTTKIGTTGGFLRRGNTTLLSGVDTDVVDDVIALIRRLCPVRTEMLALSTLPLAGEMPFLREPVEVRAGGAVVFVLDVDRFERV